MAHNIDYKKKQVILAKNGVSQEYIGPPIPEKIQMYILTRADLLYKLCYEIPCTVIHKINTNLHYYSRDQELGSQSKNFNPVLGGSKL